MQVSLSKIRILKYLYYSHTIKTYKSPCTNSLQLYKITYKLFQYSIMKSSTSNRTKPTHITFYINIYISWWNVCYEMEGNTDIVVIYIYQHSKKTFLEQFISVINLV